MRTLPCTRRRWTTRTLACLALASAATALSGCAGLVGGDTVHVSVVGLAPMAGELMEARMALKLRVQNPNDTPLNYDGVSVELDLQDRGFASGVSDAHGSIPRFGEAVIEVPVSISALAVLRQAMALAGGGAQKPLPYTLRGRLAGSGLGGLRFTSSGEIDLPKDLRGP